ACQFRTAHELTLWPIEVVEARYAPFAPDLPLNTLGLTEPVQAVLRLRLRAATPHAFQQIAMDRLNLFLAGGDEVALKLHELILGSGLGVFVGPPARPIPWFAWLGRAAIQPVGFERDQALIPYTTRWFSGYWLLHEYFAFPERFRFLEPVGLDRTKPMDFEVYGIERVVGYGEGLEVEQEFRPFYASVDADGAQSGHGYFTVRREPRALSERQRRDGPRTSYMGSEVSLSLVDAREAPYSATLSQLA